MLHNAVYYCFAGYLGIGFVAAFVTTRIFPPMEGFRPGLKLQLLAFGVFTLFWPVLVSLAIWYSLMSHYGRASESKPVASEFTGGPISAPWQGTKPR